MTTLKLPNPAPSENSYANPAIFWYQTWEEATQTSAKLQKIWLEALNEAFRHELEFLSAIAPFYSKLANCLLGFEGPQTPASLASCYHQLAGDMTHATFKRMHKVSKLNKDLRERIWCEL
ncbi:hypothetical protein [Halomonas sp. 707B3]|jgi:hypothetical protein|uniref:hypothetical protein n=1 Tax=Halomonas sp. 707B3 TaxID=1681043 RepID=UPI00209F7F20|nr:hypothetical protein [Halomonas sp. 707B3]MCP1319273.1 hypothetical protein [Halomonas sp. 707B3]